MKGRPGAGPPSSVPAADPWFAVTMTVRNNITTIERVLATIVPQLDVGGELVIVDSVSDDGTWSVLQSAAAGNHRVHVVSQRCPRGVGRNRAVELASSPIVLTQVDADNLYEPGVFAALAAHVRDRPTVGLAFAVGAHDVDPATTRFYAWRRPAFERAGRYEERQEAEETPLLLRAFRAGFEIDRLLLPRVASDLKPRAPGRAGTVGPWRRARHNLWSARKFRVIGYRYREYVRFLWLTRRTPARTVAGIALGLVGYVVGTINRDGQAVLTRDDPPPPPGEPSEPAAHS